MALDAVIAWSDITTDLFLSQYFTGLCVLDDAGKNQPPEWYEYYLQTALRKLEDITSVTVAELIVDKEAHDYHLNDYAKYAYMQLYKMPVRSVERIAAVYPTGQVVQIFPHQWVRLNIEQGQIHLVPTTGSLGQVVLGQGGDFLPLVYGGLSYVPHLWEVTYTAGMDQDNIPRTIVDAWMKIAAIEVLTIASDMVRPIGVTSESVGVDGLSQSQSYQQPAFKGRIDRYIGDLYGIEGKQQELRSTSGLLRQIHDAYASVLMAAL